MLDVDPAKVRASVVQLLRTGKDDEHHHPPPISPAVTTTSTPFPAARLTSSGPSTPGGTTSYHNPPNGPAAASDMFGPPFPARTSSAPHTPALVAPAPPMIDLNTEFDYLLQGSGGMDPFDVWGTGGGGWTDLNLLSSVDSTWPAGGGMGLWNHGAGGGGSYYGW